MNIVDKNTKIKETKTQTEKRRALMDLKVRDLKVVNNQLNCYQKEHLEAVFVEAKWLYNYILDDVKTRCKDSFVSGLTKVMVKVGSNFEERELKYLSSGMKQAIVADVKNNLTGLSASKKNGNKIGKLNFKTSYHSINLKQFDNTWKFADKNRIHISGLKKPLKVRGIKQFSKLEDIEYANAKLIKTIDGYHIKVTTYSKPMPKRKDSVGFDMGVKNQITFSNGISLGYSIAESNRLKKLQRRLSKKQGYKQGESKSNNFNKELKLIQKEYQKLSNKRKNINNHIFGYLNTFDMVFFQDENIKAWHSGMHLSRSIQHSAIGGLKHRLKTELSTPIVLDRFKPTTKCCLRCSTLNKIKLSQRIYTCDCSYRAPRDTASACSMVKLSDKTDSVFYQIANRIVFGNGGTGHITLTPVKDDTNALESFNQLKGLSVSMHPLKQEARYFNAE